MDEIGRRYLHLALHLDRHFEGFVDAYFGPPEFRAEIQTGSPRSLEALADDAQQLVWRNHFEVGQLAPAKMCFGAANMSHNYWMVVRSLSGFSIRRH